jgi:hypothetical protein
MGWWVGPTLTMTWQPKHAWPAQDARATPAYCSLEFEFFDDGTVETNWLNESSWASMCSFARLPYATDPVDKSLIRIGTPARILRACRLRHDPDGLVAACSNEPNPPADFRAAMKLRPREPEVRVGLDGFIGTWQSAAFGEDLVTLNVRSDARFAIQSSSAELPDEGWVSANDKTVELHGRRDANCGYRATARKLTLRCADPASKIAGRPVVYTRIR